MKRASLLKNVLYIVCVTVLLLVGLIAVLFSVVGKGIYAQMKADDIMPRAEEIAKTFVSAYANGWDGAEFKKNIMRDIMLSNASVYIFDNYGNGISNENKEVEYNENFELVKKYFSTVIKGERVSITSGIAGVMVGVPAVTSNNDIIGAVFVIIPIAEVQNTLQNIALEICLVTIAIAGVMLLPIYIISKKITNPIKKVADTALIMATGKLSVRAEEAGTNEARHLAKSFNVLAEALQQTVDELVIERNRLRTVLDGIGEGIISVDKNGVITHYNQESVLLMGGEKGDKPAALPAYEDIARMVLKTLDDKQKHSFDKKMNGMIVRTVITPISEDDESISGAVALISDITESERLEQTRRDYVANVSHELRTPIASIRSLADALNDGLITSEQDKKRYYGYILRESIRLSNLISDLLELSRLQSGGVAFEKNRVELYEIVYDVVDRMNNNAKERGKKVELQTPEGEYYANSNADRIEQVLVALVDNAVKHGEDGCTVKVRLDLDETENAYVFHVENPAVIDENDLKHLFDRFYKADRAHTGDGTGIGLSIVSEVLNLLNEKIWIDYKDGVITFNFTVARYEEKTHEQ